MDKKEAMEKIESWLASRDIELAQWDRWYIENIISIVALTAERKGMLDTKNILTGGVK